MKKTKNIGLLTSVTLRITVSLFLIILGIAFTALFWFYPDIRDELKFTAAIVGGLSGLYSAYYVGFSIRLNHRHNSVLRALEIAAKLDTVEKIRINTFLENEYKNVTPEQLSSKIREDLELVSAIRKLLNIFEDASIAVQKEVVDEETLFKSLATLVIMFRDKFKLFIESEREEYEDDRQYRELEALANAWIQEKSLVTGNKIELD